MFGDISVLCLKNWDSVLLSKGDDLLPCLLITEEDVAQVLDAFKKASQYFPSRSCLRSSLTCCCLF